MITKFKLFESFGLSNIINKCQFYFLIDGDLNHVLNILEPINKYNVNSIFGDSLFANILDDINKIIDKLKDDEYYSGNKVKGVFIFYAPIYYNNVKFLLIRNNKQKETIINKYSEKFIGELKIKNNKFIIDDLLVNTKKYNL